MTTSHLTNSAIATAIAEIVTLPICTLKTNFQNSKNTSIRLTAKDMYAKGGIKVFYRASYPAIGSQVISTASKYGLYRYFNDSQIVTSNKVINGMIGGCLSSLITHPIDSIKVHMQMSTPFIPELKKNGLGLFYRGYSKTFTKILIASSLFFPLYDYCKEYTGSSIVSSFISATISTTAMQPLDYLKTRHIYGQTLFQGFDPRPYYKGYSLNMMRVVPHFMITMCVIDLLERTIF